MVFSLVIDLKNKGGVNKMNSEKLSEEDVRNYLLGKLSEEEISIVNEKLSEGSNQNEFEMSESELIDDYLWKRLSEEDRKLFEANYLISDERREKVEFTKAINTNLGLE